MLRQLFRDSAVYVLGRAIAAALNIFLLPIYTAYLAPEQLGAFDMGRLVITLATLLVALEISQGAARYYCEDEDVQARREYFSTAAGFTVMAFAVFSAVGVVAAPVLAPFVFGDQAGGDALILVIAAATAIALFRLALAQLRWLFKPWSFLFCSLLQVGATAGVSVWLVAARGAGIHGLLIGLLVGNAGGLLSALWFGRRGLGFVWSGQRLRQMLSFSAPLVTSSSAVFVAAYIDRIAIKELLSMAALGRYGVAYRFATAVELIMAGVDVALMPLIYTRHKDSETPEHLAKIMRRILLFGAVILLGLALVSRDLLQVFVAEDYRDAAELVPILAGSVFLTRLSVVAPGLWIAKRTKTIAGINVIIAVVNLGLNLVLIPPFGVYGAAMATLTSAGMGFAINMTASQAQYHVPHEWWRVGAFALVVAVGIVVARELSTSWPPLSASAVGLKLLIGIGFLVLCAGALLTGEEWRAVLRRAPRA